MSRLHIFIVLLSFSKCCVFADDSPAINDLKVCDKDDLSCLRPMFSVFAKLLAKGVNEPFQAKPTDPLELDNRTYPSCCDDPPTGQLVFKNIAIKGLKDAQMDTYSMNFEDHTISLNLSTDFQFNADMTLHFKDKTFTDTIELKNIHDKANAHYPFEIKSDDKGVKFLSIGKPVFQCELTSEPEVTYGPIIEQALRNDPDLKAHEEKNAEQIKEGIRKFACEVGNIAFPYMIDGWRSALKVMPLSALLKNTDDWH